MSDHEISSREPSPGASEAPKVDPPRLELLPYAAADQAKRGSLSRTVAWVSALAAALALAAGVAAYGLYDHTRQANLVAAKTEETLGLNQTVKELAKRLDAIEAARAHDESADLRKVAAEMKTESASGRELSTQLAQANVRLDKLTDRLDHETANKFADLSTRLDKLEKRPLVAALPPAKPAAPVVQPVVATVVPPRPAAPAAQPVSNDTTGAIERPRLRGYWLVEAQDGFAVIDGRDGPQQIAPGDVLPGVGRVQRIERRGGDWVVVTSAGVIAGDQPPF